MQRHETQPWNSVVARLEIVVGGSPETGAAPVVAIRRDSDNKWLAAGGGSWAAGVATNALAHVGGDQPGLYTYAIPQGQLDATAGGYTLKITAAQAGAMPGPLHTNARIELDLQDRMPVSSTVAGTSGDMLRRMLGLRQKHQRTVYSTFDANNNPTSGIVLIYTSGAALDADSGPTWAGAAGRYDFVATYDVNGRLTQYTSKEIS